MVLRELAAAYALEHPEQVFRYTAIGANAGREVLEARDRSAQDPHTVLEVRREELYDVYICGGQEMKMCIRDSFLLLPNKRQEISSYSFIVNMDDP